MGVEPPVRQMASGPSRVEGKAEFPTNKIWNVHGAYDVKLTYPGDVRVHVSDKHNNGLKFIGEDGRNTRSM